MDFLRGDDFDDDYLPAAKSPKVLTFTNSGSSGGSSNSSSEEGPEDEEGMSLIQKRSIIIGASTSAAGAGTGAALTDVEDPASPRTKGMGSPQVTNGGTPYPRPSGMSLDNIEHKRRLSTRSLLLLLFFIVSGGPVGSEEAISSMGPFFGLLALLIFPWIYSIPIAMVCAELATAFPDDGGYTLWVSDAFGPFWAFQEGYLSYVSGVIDNAMYPVLVVDILESLLADSSVRKGELGTDTMVGQNLFRILFTCSLAWVMAIINLRGIRIVGKSLVFLCLVVIVPYIICVIVAVPYVKPSRWFIGPPWLNTDNTEESAREQGRNNNPWLLLLNTVFWNLSGWDGISTFAGEVKDPSKSYPRALLWGVVLICSVVIIPLLAAIGYDDGLSSIPPWQSWTDGSFVEIGAAIGGEPLRALILLSSLASTMALFNTVMFVGSYLLLGMAEQGLVPSILSYRHPKYDSPVLAIFASLVIINLVIMFLDFRSLMLVNNFFSALSLTLEIAAAIHLRFTQPERRRPFHVPVSSFTFLIMLLPAFLVLFFVVFGALYSIDQGGFFLALFLLAFGFVLPSFGPSRISSKGLSI